MEVSAEMMECITECHASAEICFKTMSHCLEMGGPHAEPDHVRLLLDCAAICTTSANFMIRGSEFHGRLCGVCAEVCDACAASCESLADDDEQMRRCAEQCRRSAQSCREVAAGMA